MYRNGKNHPAVTCSFCGKPAEQVEKMIAGAGVWDIAFSGTDKRPVMARNCEFVSLSLTLPKDDRIQEARIMLIIFRATGKQKQIRNL